MEENGSYRGLPGWFINTFVFWPVLWTVEQFHIFTSVLGYRAFTTCLHVQPVVHINDVTHLKEMDHCGALRAFLLKVIIFESLKKSLF